MKQTLQFTASLFSLTLWYALIFSSLFLLMGFAFYGGLVALESLCGEQAIPGIMQAAALTGLILCATRAAWLEANARRSGTRGWLSPNDAQ